MLFRSVAIATSLMISALVISSFIYFYTLIISNRCAKIQVFSDIRASFLKKVLIASFFLLSTHYILSYINKKYLFLKKVAEKFGGTKKM